MAEAAPRPSHPVLRSGREILQHYLGDLVYGANDGIITTFAVVAGVAGADLSPRIVLILGISNLLADGVSMGASNYLAIRSRGFAELEVTGAISEPYAVQHGLATFLAFTAAGSLPLLAYLVPGMEHDRFTITAVLGGSSLFVIGAARTLLGRASWWRSGLEMLMVGGAAGTISYAAGALVSRWAVSIV
jgi:vacuolar iron transporter family protein